MTRLQHRRYPTKMRHANRLAEEQATLWRVFYMRGKHAAEKLVEAPTREKALKGVRRSTGAKPCLPTSVWREIYREVGLPV